MGATGTFVTIKDNVDGIGKLIAAEAEYAVRHSQRSLGGGSDGSFACSQQVTVYVRGDFLCTLSTTYVTNPLHDGWYARRRWAGPRPKRQGLSEFVFSRDSCPIGLPIL